MQGSSYAPLQFLRSPWNRDVYTAIDNQVDGRTTLVLYLGAASTLPSELQKYNVGCILIHKNEKQIYLNTGNDTNPTWQSFGPGTNTLPTPFVAGQYLTNDGVDAFWSLIDLATGVTGLLDSDHIDLSDLANNSDFIDFLIANSYFTTSLANDTNFTTVLGNNNNFINTLTSNISFQNAVNTFVSGSGVLQIDQTPDNGTFGLLAGDVDGVNDTYTVSLGAYAAGKLQVYLNGLIQLQGASDDYVELVPGSGTFQFNTPPATNDIITVVYSGSASVVDNYTVKATTADTAPSYLDDKINIHSSDSSVSVTKSITNPAGNEIVDYDLSVTGLGAGTGPSLIYLGAGTASGPDQQFNQPLLLNKVVQNNVGSKKWGAWGTTSGGVLFGADKYFYDYDQNLVFGITIYNQSSGNYGLKIEVSSDTAPSTILYTWTTSGFSSVGYPDFLFFGFIVDIQDLKVYLTPAGVSGGTNTIGATSISSTKTDVFTLSSATGGTIDSTATSFSGANKFPAYNSTVSQEQGNSTTKKFILNYDDTKYTYTAVSGITASSVISYGNYSGSNIVLSDGKLYKAKTIGVSGTTTGITTINSYWLQVVEYPGGNTILNT